LQLQKQYSHRNFKLIKRVIESPTAADIVEFSELQQTLTCRQSFESGCMISVLKKTPEEKQMLLEGISGLVTNLCASLNLTNSVNALQLIEIAISISELHHDLKFDELIYIFKLIKTGGLGDFYNRIDIHIINSMIFSYKNGERESMLETRHKQPEAAAEPEKRTAPTNAMQFNKIYEMLDAKGKKAEPVKREKTKEQIKMDGFIKDFNEIYDNFPVTNEDGTETVIRMIEFKNKKMAVQEYCNARFNDSEK